MLCYFAFNKITQHFIKFLFICHICHSCHNIYKHYIISNGLELLTVFPHDRRYDSRLEMTADLCYFKILCYVFMKLQQSKITQKSCHAFLSVICHQSDQISLSESSIFRISSDIDHLSSMNCLESDRSNTEPFIVCLYMLSPKYVII